MSVMNIQKEKQKEIKITIRVDESMHEKLRKAANSQGTQMSSIVRKAIIKYLKHIKTDD